MWSLNAQTYKIADSLYNEAKVAEKARGFLKVAQRYEQSAETEKKSANPRKYALYYELANASFFYDQAKLLDKAFVLIQ